MDQAAALWKKSRFIWRHGIGHPICRRLGRSPRGLSSYVYRRIDARRHFIGGPGERFHKLSHAPATAFVFGALVASALFAGDHWAYLLLAQPPCGAVALAGAYESARHWDYRVRHLHSNVVPGRVRASVHGG